MSTTITRPAATAEEPKFDVTKFLADRNARDTARAAGKEPPKVEAKAEPAKPDDANKTGKPSGDRRTLFKTVRENERLKMELEQLRQTREAAEEKKPAELSGGMRKRVGLARAIALRPQIMLYDEPTTGVDPIMGDSVNDLIIELHNKLKVTSIAVTHDMTSAYKIADRIVMLHHGKIIADGDADNIRSHPDPIVQQFIKGEISQKELEQLHKTSAGTSVRLPCDIED